MVFHEITKRAIDEAIANPRDIDDGLVDAQETRRILDRLYGYEVSPVLWRRCEPGLSAGRVQSPADRLVVERERERIAFVAAVYWDLDRHRSPPRPGFFEPPWSRSTARSGHREGLRRRRPAPAPTPWRSTRPPPFAGEA
jgi:DNA topoisomerase IA